MYIYARGNSAHMNRKPHLQTYNTQIQTLINSRVRLHVTSYFANFHKFAYVQNVCGNAGSSALKVILLFFNLLIKNGDVYMADKLQ